MKDPGEEEQDGSLIIANYGKGRFVYTGLGFFQGIACRCTGRLPVVCKFNCQ